MKVFFQKISGAKNLFLIADTLDQSTDANVNLVKKVCDPYEGFYADGVVFVSPMINKEYNWDFYNSDGSSAEMCGNAVRCVHHYIQKRDSLNSAEIILNTLSGKIKSDYKDGSFHVQMPKPTQGQSLQLSPDFFGDTDVFQEFAEVAEPQAFFVNTGVPHLVIEVKDLDKAMQLNPIWIGLRHHVYFENGTNVTLIKSRKNGSVSAVSFERGVDDFTQACGTGAVAAGIYIGQIENRNEVTVFMPGGELKVNLQSTSPILIGQVVDVGQVIVETKE